MKTIVRGVVGLAAFAAFPALAADLPTRVITKAPPPAPVVRTWTGCFVGAGGGYKMWNIDHDALDTTGALANGEGTSGGRGWLATAQVGCDYQFASNWLVGIFADWDWTGAKGDYNERYSPLAVSQIGSLKERWAWGVGGRLGYVVTPQLLTYVGAGYTEANFESLTFTEAATGVAPAFGASTGITLGERTFKGWFFTGGTEYALGWLPGLYWKNEYRFASFDQRTDPLVCTSTAPGVCGTAGAVVGFDRARLYQQSVRTELVYRFGGGAVMARY